MIKIRREKMKKKIVELGMNWKKGYIILKAYYLLI